LDADFLGLGLLSGEDGWLELGVTGLLSRDLNGLDLNGLDLVGLDLTELDLTGLFKSLLMTSFSRSHVSLPDKEFLRG
jgi:hypothetical protein